MTESERERELGQRLSEDRGDAAFAELADLQMARGAYQEALGTLLAGLSANPSHQVGRLILGRLFLHLNYAPFAIRELLELRAQAPQCESLRRLIEAVAPGTLASLTGAAIASGPAAQSVGVDSQSEDVVAEDEFDFDILESLEEKKR